MARKHGYEGHRGMHEHVGYGMETFHRVMENPAGKRAVWTGVIVGAGVLLIGGVAWAASRKKGGGGPSKWRQADQSEANAMQNQYNLWGGGNSPWFKNHPVGYSEVQQVDGVGTMKATICSSTNCPYPNAPTTYVKDIRYLVGE